MDYSTSVLSTRCQAGRQHLDVTVTMSSHAPSDVASLPDYVTGSEPSVPRGTARTTAYLYAPLGGYVTSSTYDGGEAFVETGKHGARQVLSQTIDLAPGQKHTLTFEVVGGKGQTERTHLRVTPGANGTGVGEVGPSACR
jgi:hypothetical protein